MFRKEEVLMEKENGELVNIADAVASLEGTVNPRGGLDVNIQDQTTEMVNLYFSREIQEFTIVEDATINTNTLTISALAEPTNGSLICLKENIYFYQGIILSHSANGDNWDIVLDSPLDFGFTTAGGCSERSNELNVDGSLTPVEFIISPLGLNNVKWDIYGIVATMLDATDMDDAKFGGGAALTKGIVLRVEDGYNKNFFNAKSNEDIKISCELEYSAKAPAGQYGLKFHYDISKENGVAIRLDSNDSDKLKVIVQDNLTGLDSFKMKIHGHVVD